MKRFVVVLLIYTMTQRVLFAQAVFANASGSQLGFNFDTFGALLNGCAGVSVSAWVRLTQGPSGGSTLISLFTGLGGRHVQRLYTDGTRVSYSAYSRATDTAQTVSTEPLLLTNTIRHITGTTDFGSKVMSIYIDGVLVTQRLSAAFGTNFFTHTSVAASRIDSVGATDAGTAHLVGILDDVRVYSKCLSASEAALVYLSPSKCPDPSACLLRTCVELRDTGKNLNSLPGYNYGLAPTNWGIYKSSQNSAAPGFVRRFDYSSARRP